MANQICRSTIDRKIITRNQKPNRIRCSAAHGDHWPPATE